MYRAKDRASAVDRAATSAPAGMAIGALKVGAASGGSEVGGSAASTTPQGLYDSHFSFVWRNLRLLGVPEETAEDAAQDVFLVVHRRWDSFNAEWSTVETWLFGILLRVTQTHRRTVRRRAWSVGSSREDAENIPSTDEDPAELVARREAARFLDRLLDELDDGKRAIVVMVDVEQLSVPQAAEALGISLSSAYWRLRAARGELKRALLRAKALESRLDQHMRKTP